MQKYKIISYFNDGLYTVEVEYNCTLYCSKDVRKNFESDSNSYSGNIPNMETKLNQYIKVYYDKHYDEITFEILPNPYYSSVNINKFFISRERTNEDLQDIPTEDLQLLQQFGPIFDDVEIGKEEFLKHIQREYGNYFSSKEKLMFEPNSYKVKFL